jgi:phosphotransferase system  glucose/maltose/N-acetylglucosamine-specific IIC component
MIRDLFEAEKEEEEERGFPEEEWDNFVIWPQWTREALAFDLGGVVLFPSTFFFFIFFYFIIFEKKEKEKEEEKEKEKEKEKERNQDP